MKDNYKRVRILISTTSITQLSDGEVADIILGSTFSELAQAEGACMGNGIEMADDISLFDGYASDGADCQDGSHADETANGTVRVSVLGIISEKDGVTVLSYAETELTDMSGSHTTVSFEDKGEVTLVRTGTAKTTLCFNDKRQRRLCCYNDSFIPLELAVITEKFENTLDAEKGGTLDVTYSVELKGLPVESTRLQIKVKPLG